MAFMEKIHESITFPRGFTAAGVHCGIRKNRTKNDLSLIVCEKLCDAAAVYTTNKVKGAPLYVTQEHLRAGKARAVICNSGNANTCNVDGVERANEICGLLAKELSIAPEEIVIASTGVIGEPINMDPFYRGVPMLVSRLSEDGATDAALGIMTTDSRPKQLSFRFELDGRECRIGAIAKGSGMINPNMATMLCFITTDVDIDGAMLQAALTEVVGETFNMISIDGDTSTNDMVTVLASGLAGNSRIQDKGESYRTFVTAMTELCADMARAIATDGEGATKLLECTVSGADTKEAAKTCAMAVIKSPLVKTAMFGEDANWGRILCALGYSGADFDVDSVGIILRSVTGSVTVAQNGRGTPFDEDEAKKVLSAGTIVIDVSVGSGPCSATGYGCDLTYDYVRINGDYRT